MLNLEWRWIHVGDHVLVHDPADPLAPLRRGTVVVAERERTRTRVGIRLHGEDTNTTVWPSVIDVHRDPRDPDDLCWRCVEAASVGPRAEPAEPVIVIGSADPVISLVAPDEVSVAADAFPH